MAGNMIVIGSKFKPFSYDEMIKPIQVADAEPWFLTLTEVLHTYRSGKSPPAQLLFIPLVVVNELLLASVTA